MHQPARVQRGEPVQDLERDLERARDVAGVDRLVDGRAVDVIHGEVGLAARQRAVLVDPHHVLVAHAREGAVFVLHQPGGGAVRDPQPLERTQLARLGVANEPDVAQAALAELADLFVAVGDERGHAGESSAGSCAAACQ